MFESAMEDSRGRKGGTSRLLGGPHLLRDGPSPHDINLLVVYQKIGSK